MSEQTLKNIIRKTLLRAEGVINYAYQGGEPTLRGIEFFEKAIAYQKQYNKNNIRVNNALQTNGYALDEDWCRFLNANHFLVGLSVDGTKEIHDSMRHSKGGEDTFDRICHAAELMDKYQVDYNILTVVTPKIAENAAAVYREYKARGWNYQQYIACLDPLGEGHGKTPFSLPPDLYGKFLVDLFDLWYQDLQKGRQPYIRQFENYVGLAAGYIAESCDQRGTCAVQYVVEADGGVYPCDFYMLDDYKLGSFNENLLDQLDNRRKEIGFVERSLMLDSKCKDCQYYRLCRGGCQRNRDFNAATGMYESYFCESYRIFFDACHARITEIAKNIW